MTRKDYVALAAAINEVRMTIQRGFFLSGPNGNGSVGQEAIGAVEMEISKTLYRDNPRFNRERFIAACRKGIDQ